jgi:hypothetical protein
MSVAYFDPDETAPEAYDDRDNDVDPDFEMNEVLAYNIGWEEPDFEALAEMEQAELEFEARLDEMEVRF